MSKASAPVPVSISPEEVHHVLRALDGRARLLKIVKTMSHEIERLHQNNAQLQAAVKMYREKARRSQKDSG